MTSKNADDRPRVGVGLLLMRNDNILLGKRKQAIGAGTYACVGGHLEFGETLEECAHRELREEIGLTIVKLRLLCVSNIIAYGTHYLDFEFVAECPSGEPQLLEPKKVEHWKWYPLNRLPSPL